MTYDHQDDLIISDLEVSRLAQGGAVMVRFTLGTFDEEVRPVRRTVHYTVDFLAPAGTVDSRIRGWSAGGETVVVLGNPSWDEGGELVVRCVTDQGRSAGVTGTL
jgi:hypothetical protein